MDTEPKIGYWIPKDVGQVTSYHCSICGRFILDDTGYDVVEDYPYCNCGAKMDKWKGESKMTNENYELYSIKDWALYFAKLYDLNADEMDAILDDLKANKADDVLENYGNRVVPEARSILLANYHVPLAPYSYYEIKNTVDEYHEKVSRRCVTFEKAKEELADCSDWYRDNGTGEIYRVTLTPNYDKTLTESRELIYKK